MLCLTMPTVMIQSATSLNKQTERGSYSYTYDALSRLTDVQVDVPGEENEGFDYDAVGNRVAQDGVDGEWSYNANNELLAGTEPRPTAPVDFEYHYDENGNATQLLLDGAVMFTYHYNAQDRLVKVDDVNGGTIAEYAYDPFGRRLWKEVGGTRTSFFYADEGLVAEYDSAGNESTSYGYTPDATWTTDPLWLKQNGEYYFYQNDHLGTPQKLVKQNGAVVWSASYTAFGQATVEVEIVTNNLRFPGQYYDAETGLHYNWHRYYAPGLGRYLRNDPLGAIRGGGSLYLYVGANPLIVTDPTGLLNAAACLELFRQIMRAAYELAGKLRKYDPVEDGKGDHVWKHGGKTGKTKPGTHYDGIKDRQRGLKQKLGYYFSECFDDDCQRGPRIPVWVDRVVNQQIPRPIIPPTPAPTPMVPSFSPPDLTPVVVGVVVVVVVGIIIYASGGMAAPILIVA